MTTTTRLLVLGGSDFVGRAVADDAVARGWDVTVLNRGRRGVPGVRALVGDRTAPDGLAALADGAAAGESWDVVVDTWSWAPAAVRRSAGLLADRAGRYAYVSSRSVYADPPRGADESAAVVDGDAAEEEATDYARAKRGAELAVETAFGERALLLRPGLVLGPRENVGRLPWWLRRTARGGDVVAPGPRDLPLQLVDARDLAAFALDLATTTRAPDAAGAAEAVDVVSPSGHATTASLLEACVAVTAGAARAAGAPPARLVWVTPEDVAAADVAPWTELPVWLPPGEVHDALHRSDVSRATALGLRPRPVEDTVAGTWEWLSALDGDAPQRADRPHVGLPREKEEALLRRA